VAPAGSTPTGGWLLSNWTQSAPYNNLCPLDVAHGSVRSQAGCPSVAMAMILNYHGTIQGTTLGAGDRYWHAYAGNNYWIPDGYLQYGFPNFPTLNGYLQTLTAHWDAGSSLTNTDKAALVFACGVAATQVYSAAGSGTFGVAQAYAAFQRFGFTDSRLVFDTDPDLYPDLMAQMQNAHPAHLAIVDPAGPWATTSSSTATTVTTTTTSTSAGAAPTTAGTGCRRNSVRPDGGRGAHHGYRAGIDNRRGWRACRRRAHPRKPSESVQPRTVIRFTAPTTGRARLAVYDLAEGW